MDDRPAPTRTRQHRLFLSTFTWVMIAFCLITALLVSISPPDPAAIAGKEVSLAGKMTIVLSGPFATQQCPQHQEHVWYVIVLAFMLVAMMGLHTLHPSRFTLAITLAGFAIWIFFGMVFYGRCMQYI